MAQSVLAKLYSRSLAVDVILKVDGDERAIQAHRNILLGASEYFETIFTKDFKEKDLGKITLKDMRFETLKTLIDFIYTGELTLGCSFLEAFVAADYLMIDCVMLKLNDYATKATVENCIDLYWAHKYLNAASKEALIDFISRNLERLTTRDEYSALSVDQLLNILKECRSVNLHPWYHVVAINAWVLADPEKRYQHVHCLLSTVTFRKNVPGSTSISLIMEKIEPICKSSESRDFLIALLAWKTGYTNDYVKRFIRS